MVGCYVRDFGDQGCPAGSEVDVEPKTGGFLNKYPQIIHLFIGFSIINHHLKFWGGTFPPIFGSTPWLVSWFISPLLPGILGMIHSLIPYESGRLVFRGHIQPTYIGVK